MKYKGKVDYGIFNGTLYKGHIRKRTLGYNQRQEVMPKMEKKTS